MSAYVHNEKQGREQLSHPAWLAHAGEMVLDWAWDDRDKTPTTYDEAGRAQDVATRWWSRLLTKGSVVNDLLGRGPVEANALHLMHGLYLFGREHWRPGAIGHAGLPTAPLEATATCVMSKEEA